jgi:hypothetical protein
MQPSNRLSDPGKKRPEQGRACGLREVAARSACPAPSHEKDHDQVEFSTAVRGSCLRARDERFPVSTQTQSRQHPWIESRCHVGNVRPQSLHRNSDLDSGLLKSLGASVRRTEGNRAECELPVKAAPGSSPVSERSASTLLRSAHLRLIFKTAA